MMKDIPLGKHTEYVSHYDKSLLFPISRSENRARLGITSALPFDGFDVWTGFEMSWLNPKGKPQVAIAEFTIPCTAPNIIESKSFKLYLNSYNQTQFDTQDAVIQQLQLDLSEGFGAEIQVKLFLVDDYPIAKKPVATLIDELDVDCSQYEPTAEMTLVQEGQIREEFLCTHLLKSNCPVTGQPDWATLWIDYKGSAIDHEALLKYVVSFRQHSDFHEHCVETIFSDILAQGSFERLNIAARYTRRGGLDINPIRTLKGDVWQWPGRTARQ